MTEFLSEIRRRIAQTREDLAVARAEGDDYLLGVRLGELESLARLAAENGIEVEGVRESLAEHGITTPSLGVPLVVDLRHSRQDGQGGQPSGLQPVREDSTVG